MNEQSNSPLQQTAFEIGSPVWLIFKCEEKSGQLFSRLLQFFGKGLRFRSIYFSATALCCLIYVIILSSPLKPIFNNDIYSYINLFLEYSVHAVWVVLLISILNLLGYEVARLSKSIPTLLMISGMILWYVITKKPLILFLVYAAFFAILIAYLYLLSYSRSGKARGHPNFSKIFWGFLTLLAIWWTLVDLFLPSNILNKLSISPEKYFFIVSLFWGESTHLFKTVPFFSRERVWQIFSPMNFLLPMPISSHLFKVVDDEKKYEVRLLGLIDLYVATASGILYFLGQKFYFNSLVNNQTGYWRIPIIGFIFYILLYLKSFWIFRLVIGLGRCLDLNLQDGFHYALLAATPIERWSRWSIPYYNWLRDYIFFPILAKKRSLILAIISAFAMSFFLHAFRHFYRITDESLLPQRFFSIRSIFVYYLLQGLVIFFTYKSQKYWPSGNRRVGWVGVIATLLLMSTVHFFVWLTV